MIIFPEGTCVNNKFAIRFQKGAFELGVKVCPVGIKYVYLVVRILHVIIKNLYRYDRYFGDPYWDTRKGFMYYAYYRMTRWMTPVDIVYCEPESPNKQEEATQYSDRVKDVIATAIGIENVNFNGMAKRDLLTALGESEK